MNRRRLLETAGGEGRHTSASRFFSYTRMLTTVSRMLMSTSGRRWLIRTSRRRSETRQNSIEKLGPERSQKLQLISYKFIATMHAGDESVSSAIAREIAGVRNDEQTEQI